MTLPFLKWPGGKRWLVQSYREAFLPVSGIYFEPFLGAGAAFFMTSPHRAFLSDANSALINVYEQIRAKPHQFLHALRVYQHLHSAEFYYKERSKIYNSDLQRAVQFTYLNRTCFNGIYRVNRQGSFNVPIGTKTTVVMDTDDFLGISAALLAVDLMACTFEEAVSYAKAGDFIYADPPYTVKHNMNGFIKYNHRLFQWSDQEKLKECLTVASKKGVNVLVSNANHESVAKLYNGDWRHYIVERSSIISAARQHRGSTTELLISNFDIPSQPATRSGKACTIEVEILDGRVHGSAATPSGDARR